MSKAIKINNRLVSYRATLILSFQNESFHGSAFSDQTKHFRILVPILKYTFFISSTIPRDLSVYLRYALFVCNTA